MEKISPHLEAAGLTGERVYFTNSPHAGRKWPGESLEQAVTVGALSAARVAGRSTREAWAVVGGGWAGDLGPVLRGRGGGPGDSERCLPLTHWSLGKLFGLSEPQAVHL